jgi:hypothetical protein
LTIREQACEITKEGIRQGDIFIEHLNIFSVSWGAIISSDRWNKTCDFSIEFSSDDGRRINFQWKVSENRIEEQQRFFNEMIDATYNYVLPALLPKIEKIKQEMEEKEKNKPLIWLEYNSYQEVILNGIFYIHKCQGGQMNDRLLRFLFENPNQTFSREELFEKNVLKNKSNEEMRSISKETKSFYQFPEDIGISGDLKKLFFGKNLSENTICLTNPINQENINEAKVGHIEIFLKTDKKSKNNKK